MPQQGSTQQRRKRATPGQERIPAHELKRMQRQAALERRLAEAEQEESFERELLEASELDDGPATVRVELVDGSSFSVEVESTDPPIVLFGDVPFFDLGSELVATERVQRLSFEPLGDEQGEGEDDEA